MKRKRFKFIGILVLLLSFILSACSGGGSSATSGDGEAAKSDFPKKPIKLFVTFAPGGSSDIVARALAEATNKYLPNGQTVVVENKPGGAGTVGVTEVLSAKADGYTVGLTAMSPLAIQPHYGKTTYQLDDVGMLMQITSQPLVLAVKNDAPWKTYEEWLQYVKENPGKFRYGVQGSGGISQIVMEAVNKQEGTKTEHIPYDGSAPAMTALLGGHVEGAVVQDMEAKTYVDSGDVRILFSSEASMLYKDITTLKDAGIDFEMGTWSGLIMPKDVPEDIRDILHESFKKGLEDSQTEKILSEQGLSIQYAGPEEFKTMTEDDSDVLGKIMKDTGLIK